MTAMTPRSTPSALPFMHVAVAHATERYRVMQALSDGRWHTASSLRAVVAERTMREIAEQSDGEIISGQKGYRLTQYATATECRHAEAWLQSQGRKMIARAIAIRNARARCRRP